MYNLNKYQNFTKWNKVNHFYLFKQRHKTSCYEDLTCIEVPLWGDKCSNDTGQSPNRCLWFQTTYKILADMLLQTNLDDL